MLNPALYAALEELFPEGVRITNENEPLIIGRRMGSDSKYRQWKEQSGEQYAVCCPICGDTRYRLHISYAWGLDDKNKYPTSKLVICFNERCHANKCTPGLEGGGNARRWLEERLRKSYLSALRKGLVFIKSVVKDRKKEETIPFPKPEWVSPLNMLPTTHEAVQYVLSRKFEPIDVSTRWKVVYAHEYPVESNGKDYSWLAGRLFIPTVGSGWQARDITGTSKAKYFSCPGWRKSEGLYNFEGASKYPYTLLCEGVTDVWRVGDPAIAIFGKAISNVQAMKIRKHWGVVGVLLDPDTEEDKVNSMRRAMTQLSSLGIKVFRIGLYGNKDAGDCTYEHVWDCIEKAAVNSGFTDIRRPDV